MTSDLTSAFEVSHILRYTNRVYFTLLYLGSRDHKCRSGWFAISGPVTPTLYLARFSRC